MLDVVVRIAGVTVLLFLGMMLARDGRGRYPAALFVPLALCLVGFLIGNTPDPALRLGGGAGVVAHLLSGYAAVFLWWFCLACFDWSFRLRGPALAVGGVWLFVASADRGLLGPGLADRGLSWLLVAFAFLMVAHLAWRLLRDREGDLIERRRDARILVVLLLGGQLLLDLAVDLLFGFAWRPRSFAIAQNMMILAFGLWLSARLLNADVDALAFHGPRRALKPVPVPSAVPGGAGQPDERLVERLAALIEVERVHLDPALTFATFVRKMGASERAVRQFINRELGHDHFRAFLNACRMAEARRLLADPRRSRDKLIALALDSGFASLASFNRVFRAWEGCTPSQYREANLPGASASPRAPGPPVVALDPPFEERSPAF